MKICLFCKKEFKAIPSKLKKRKFCSKPCKNNAFKGRHLSPSTELKRGHTLGKGRKMSEKQKMLIKQLNKEGKIGMLGKKHTEQARKKISEAQKGNKSYSWKGGISAPNEIARKSVEYKLWREQVYERDKFECQICGIMGKELQANHIKKFADYPELRYEITNGITLCKNCHFKWVNRHESEWESYFNFNLMTRYDFQ